MSSHSPEFVTYVWENNVLGDLQLEGSVLGVVIAQLVVCWAWCPA